MRGVLQYLGTPLIGFAFRKEHVGQAKAEIAKLAVLKFATDPLSITAHHKNVKDACFDVDFFRKFSIVLNGLDNLDARRHVNRMALAASVPLVESGTAGYRGQVRMDLRSSSL